MKRLSVFVGLLLFFSQVGFAEQIRGFYSSGSMSDVDSILEHQTSVQKLFRSRAMHYTSVYMRDLLENLHLHLRALHPDVEMLQVGDLSAKNGGKIPRHASHQNGLDADVVYLRHNRRVQDIHAPEWIEDFISGAQVSPNFETERNWAAFTYLVEHYPIGRIFVDRVVKKHLCQYVQEQGMARDPLTRETLRRLRPANYHRTHFHIRLKCPLEQKQCQEQAEPPEGTGCSENDLQKLDVVPQC